MYFKTVVFTLAFGFAAPAAIAADPLESLPKEKQEAIFILYRGYSDAMICNKIADVEVGAAFLKAKFGDDKFTPDQLAHYTFLMVAIHTRRIAEMLRKGKPEKVFPEHCKEIEKAYGPDGKSIPGLLKNPPKQ